MTNVPIRTRRPVHRGIVGLVVAATLALVVALTPAGTAIAKAIHPVDPPPAQPVSASQIQNVDQVKTAIKAYYGDHVEGTNPDGSPQHLPSATGAYAQEMAGLEASAEKDIAKTLPHLSGVTPAIVLDVDDTTLNTFNYEIFSNFVFNPTTNATFVNSAAFPAVFGMPTLAGWATSHGIAVFFITGRPETQRPGTELNLTNVGYSVTSDHLFLKDQTLPWLTSCTPTCTTTQYKTLTRQHLESLGFEIVGNFGDQFSDLVGGFADLTFKVPNPMYFIP
jgi:hypothetical protein